ncbi:hypothetical protein PZB75_18330 [Streptomyces sp. AM 4-1-1]|nr:rhomboid-like protein [Streptomyces sp. AM 4-1-1]WEH35146.1 hypothetical protein PZB75_18330 [Streptomyces sp. AM 4-1-1]
MLAWAVRTGHAPVSAVNSPDADAGYAFAGIDAVPTCRAPWSSRYAYGFAGLVVHGVPLVTGRTFTGLGHFTAVLVGPGCRPLTRGRPSRPAGPTRPMPET